MSAWCTPSPPTAASWRNTTLYGPNSSLSSIIHATTFLLCICSLFVLKVIKETEEFEKSLKEMEYLQGDSTDLLKYARDVNCHFASKKCKDVIVAARKLMTSKMHNTVKVCEAECLSVLLS